MKMAEAEPQSTPLIDPEKVKAIIHPEVVKPEVVPGVLTKKQPSLSAADNRRNSFIVGI